jgi:hypothetical protein
LDTDENHDCSRNVYELFTNNKKLTTQLDPCWKEAVEICNVLLSTNGEDWCLILKYGFDYSSWEERLSKGSNISKVLKNANDKLSELTAKSKIRLKNLSNSSETIFIGVASNGKLTNFLKI